MRKSVKKPKRAKEFEDPKLAFVKEYKYTLEVDELVPSGAAQYVLFLVLLFLLSCRTLIRFHGLFIYVRSFDAGQEHFVRYAALVDADTLPFVRASESDRVIDSARNWTAGEDQRLSFLERIFLMQLKFRVCERAEVHP